MWMKISIRGEKTMKYVDESIKFNEFFVDKKARDINPDFADYKLNNYMAFRTMAEIIINNGNIDSPTFNKDLRDFIRDGFPGENGDNVKTLSKKVEQFARAWKEIKKHSAFKASITAMATGFFSSWDEYQEAIKQYRTREDFPTYLDINNYLNKILDDNGNFVEPSAEDQKKYLELATNWRMDIENSYQLYRQSKEEQS